MKPPPSLVAEWYARADALARQRGDRDIETPKGDLRGNGKRIGEKGVGAAEFHAHCEEDGSFELAAAKRQFLHAHRWPDAEMRSVWEGHVDGLSARAIAKKLRLPRQRVDRRLVRCLRAFERRDARRPGRPVDPDSLRSEGVRVRALLSRGATLALDHLRSVLQVTEAEAVRQALVFYARHFRASRN